MSDGAGVTRRAAYFEARADYFGRPLDDGILRALLANGFDIDVYAPNGDLPQTLYPANVRRLPVEYRRAWLQRHMARRSWREYDLFLGTTDLPMAFAGTIAKLAGRPSVTVVDEIYLGGYEGLATTLYWKKLSQWAMRRAAFTIITDEVRIPLQREYASLPPQHEFLLYPCAYPTPYAGRSPAAAREALGIAGGDFLLSSTGAFTSANACDWLVRLCNGDVRSLIQTGGRPDPVLDSLLQRLSGPLYFPERLEWRESTEITVAADAAAALYLSPKSQFQAMGISSQKLCTALWLGIPVIATRQNSFRFIDQYRCGELIDREEELPGAIGRIRENREEYAANAGRAMREYVRAEERLQALTERFRKS
jgi:glycosyltransferase involved in cell wall biosynthesis